MQTLLSQRGAATLLALSERTLERLRVNGGGPRFIKVGASVRYQQEALERWVARRSGDQQVSNRPDLRASLSEIVYPKAPERSPVPSFRGAALRHGASAPTWRLWNHFSSTLQCPSTMRGNSFPRGLGIMGRECRPYTTGKDRSGIGMECATRTRPGGGEVVRLEAACRCREVWEGWKACKVRTKSNERDRVN
jgi:hypothetical protein